MASHVTVHGSDPPGVTVAPSSVDGGQRGSTMASRREDTALTVSDQAKLQADVLGALDTLGASLVQADAIKFAGTAITLPEAMAPNVGEAIRHLQAFERSQEESVTIARKFNYLPADGAAAFHRAVRRVFGTTVAKGMFGPLNTIDIHTATGVLGVPWGDVSVPALDGYFRIGYDIDAEHGPVSEIRAMVPGKHRGRVAAFLAVIEDELINRSIYKGHAIHLVGDGVGDVRFLDLSKVDTSKVTYSKAVADQLAANVWVNITHADTLRRLGLPVKRSVLLAGLWGTGKSLGAALTGKLANENGWTYVLARPGQDDLSNVIRVARTYAPSVVVWEDLDTVASDLSSDYLSQLLDMLDGVGAKGSEVVTLFTTNHAERVAKGVLRPGRIDAVIEFGALDAEGTRRLVEVTIAPENRDTLLEWDRIAEAFTEYVPAFAAEAINRAMRSALVRDTADGLAGFTVTTDDLVVAAQGLRAQVALMDAADEGTERDATIDDLLRSMVVKSVSNAIVSYIPRGATRNEVRHEVRRAINDTEDELNRVELHVSD